MGQLSEFSLPLRMFLKTYSWRKIHPIPWKFLSKPLSQCKMAIVSSAGLVTPQQAPFDHSIRSGDPSFREIPNSVDMASLVDSHGSRSYDHDGVRQDPNLALPIDRLRELKSSGRIGSVNHRHLSFMGSITAPGKLVRDIAPKAARLLVEDGVDVVLLIPV